jgi:predicted DNA-binding transcriptional regulator AlpA
MRCNVLSSKNPDGTRWVRNKQLCEFLGTTPMTLWRWQRTPALSFPQPAVINGIQYTDIQEVERWMRARVVSQLNKEVA